MQLVALVDSPDHVCCRYRLAAFRPHLERAGHSLALVSLPKGWWARAALFCGLRGASVILQRKLMPRWLLHLLRFNARHLIFDVDDAIFLRDSYARKGLHHPRRLRRFAATVCASDAVIAGNRFLADEAARWTDPGRVHLVPTCVDPRLYAAAAGWSAGDGRTLVWIGSSSTLQGLEATAPLLEQLGRCVPGLRLKVICDRFPAFRHLRVEPVRWAPASEAAELAGGDVGISWVPDDLWSRGKCGLKLLQYMAAGLPVVANPVGVQAEIVRHGETGFLAATPADWCAAVGRLADDAALRRQLGEAGRESLHAGYTVAHGARRWLDVLARLHEQPEAGRARHGWVG